MEVLNLATSDKQDEILSNFPISGGTDFNEGVRVIESLTMSSAQPVGEIYSVSGKGILLLLKSATNNNGQVSISFDGENEILIGSLPDNVGMIPFDGGIKIYKKHEVVTNGKIHMIYILN